MLSRAVLEQAQEELLDWQDTGMSVMEIGHRTDEFKALLLSAENALRTLLNIPDAWQVLFLAGAARTQFAMIPMNFIRQGQSAGYLVTGVWSSLAFEEAKRLKNAYCIASSEKQSWLSVPPESDWMISDESAYMYYTPNETINGIRCGTRPKKTGVPLVADMTSCLLTEPIDVTDYDLIFAGAQKNIANAGLTVVIVRKSWLETIQDDSLPTMLDYRTHASSHSLYATPPTFNCYIALHMFQWMLSQGGVAGLYEKNRQKANLLYECIDASSLYQCLVAPEDRSLVNVCFKLPTPGLEDLFIEKAKSRGLLALRGHRLTGGLRASMYNSMPLEGVLQLISFMREFEKTGGASLK